MIRADYIVLAAFILMIGTHGITQYLVVKTTDQYQSQERIDTAIQLIEQNPLASFVLQFKKVKFLYSFVLVPSIMGAIYWFLRNKYKEKPLLLECYAVSLFITFLINFFNDAAYLAGLLL